MKPLFVSKRFRAFIFLFVYIWPSWISKFRLFVWHEQILRLATFTFLRKISWFYVFFSHTHGRAKLANLGFLPHIKQILRFRTFSCLRKISCSYFCSPTLWLSWISKFRLLVWSKQISGLATFTFLRKILCFYVFARLLMVELN